MSDTKRCKSCGNPVDLEVAQAHDGACPWCLAAFTFSPEPVGNPATASKDPSKQFGKYVRTEKLGAGGMGEVWKALDTELNRWVALKFLKDEDPSVVARFQREAKTAAALSHPNIAAIYEVGEIEGRHYIAMQHIEGQTMASFPKKDRRLIVRLFRDAARAVDHAHRHRIIHRDLKPDNLMVEEKGDDWSVVVLDFGLARPIEGGEKLSQSGEVYGTAAYMSPEQARGDHLDERADVYSLGATMYEVLTGTPPFQAANLLELLRKVGQEEPPKPRKLNPRLHRDLETVILKCLEKDRERRYASARELAEDLERFLNNDPILARPPSTLYRLRMKLGKRKAVVATAAIAASLLAAALSWWLVIGSPGSQHLRRMADGLKLWHEARIAAVGGANPGDIRAKARSARERFEGAIEARESAEARLMRAKCLELEGGNVEALKDLERAQALEPKNAEVRMEIVKALFLKYQSSRGTPKVVHQRPRLGEEPIVYISTLPPESDEERGWRERGEKILAEGDVPPAQESLLKGLLAMGKGDYARAAAALGVYTDAERWDVQALTLLGVSLYHAKNFDGAIAVLDRALGRVPQAEGYYWRAAAREDRGLYQEALADYNRALELDRLYVHAYVSRARIKFYERLFDDVIADNTKAIELDPKCARAYVGRACAKGNKGLYDEAITDLSKAIELDPRSAFAHSHRGLQKRSKGHYDEAIADYDEAIKLDPKFARAYVGRGFCKDMKGQNDEAILDCTLAIDVDPKDAWAYGCRADAKLHKGLYDQAIADYTRAIDLDPKSAHYYANRGIARCERGLLDSGIEDCSKAIELEPTSALLHSNRADFRSLKGLHVEAMADCNKALELNPNDAGAYYVRGLVMERKGLPEKAIADYSKAVELDPKHSRAWTNRGAIKAGKGLTEEALADYEKALEVDPARWEAHYNLARIRMSKSLWDDAIAGFTKVLQLSPKFAEAQNDIGTCKWHKGLFDEAIADYTKAIAMNPRYALPYFYRGSLKDSKGLTDEAMTDYKRALELAPPGSKLRTEIEERLAVPREAQLLREANRLFDAKKYREAIAKYRAVVEGRPKSQEAVSAAYNIACGHALLGEKNQALDWLEKSVQMGWSDLSHIEDDQDLESLRGEARYRKLVEKLKSE